MEEIKQKKLIIEGLQEPITIEDIINHFKDCGPIEDAIIYNSNNFISAEIFFKDKSSLLKALNKNSTKINNSIINIHIPEEDNNIYNIKERNYNTRSSKKDNSKLNSENNDIFEGEELEDSLISNKKEINSQNQSKESYENIEKEESNKEGEIIKKMNISDIDNNSYNSEEDEISDNEGYNNFMKEYKQYCKGMRKAMNNNADGEMNIQDLLNQANNFYLNNEYAKAKEVLEKIISVFPNLQEPYLILSQIYEEEKNDEKSLFFLMLAAQSSGGDKNIWIKCCNYNKKLKNYRQAEYCITRALK